MKKLIVIFFLLLFGSVSALAQIEALGCLGADLLRGKDKTRGDNEFAEVRLMFGKPGFRFGPVFNGVYTYFYQGGYYYRGRDLTGGLSFDTWKRGENIDRYFWVNIGIRFSRDHGWDGNYESFQNDHIGYLWGGLTFNSPMGGWFGLNTIMFEAQTPLTKGVINARYQNDTLWDADPYNKERIRAVGETGVKQISFFLGNNYLALNPLIHVGYGWETGSRHQFCEVGAGFSFGSLKDDGYREFFKFKVYNRQSLNYQRGNGSNYPSSWVFEAGINFRIPLTKNK